VPHPTTAAIVSYFILVALGVLVHVIERARRQTTGEISVGKSGKSGWQRFLDFIEQPLFLVVVSIIGGIVGVLVYTPVFLVCDVCILLALHRSKAVADQGTKSQVFWYTLTFVITTSILLWVGISLRRSARNFVHDLAKAVAEATQTKVAQTPVQSQPQPAPNPQPSPPPPRSYLVFDGTMRFAERRDANGQLVADQNLHVGDELFFNYYFKPTGPNAISVGDSARVVRLEPDFSPKSQQEALEYFRAEIKKDDRDHPVKTKWATMMPQETGHWDTARAWTEDRHHLLITKLLLDELTVGTQIAFVLVEVSYKDNRKLHHMRTCQFLQPPAIAPGTWHFCEDFVNPD
jgi:hypothetical protein